MSTTAEKIRTIGSDAIKFNNTELEAKFKAAIEAGARAEAAGRKLDEVLADESQVNGVLGVAKTYASVDDNLSQEVKDQFRADMKEVITNSNPEVDAALDEAFDATVDVVNSGNDLSAYVDGLLEPVEPGE